MRFSIKDRIILLKFIEQVFEGLDTYEDQRVYHTFDNDTKEAIEKLEKFLMGENEKNDK